MLDGTLHGLACREAQCSSMPSVIWRSMESTGFSEVTGSWKIIAMSLPRTLRTSLSGSATRSRPSNSITPGGGGVAHHAHEAEDGERR